MLFKNEMGEIRALGSKLVLPVDLIKKLMQEKMFDKYYIDKVIDFGAGTLYWSKWFRKIFGIKMSTQ